MKLKSTGFIGIAVFFMLSTCTPDSKVVREVGVSYFPLEEGTTREYEIIETSYNLSSLPVRNTFREKETITGSFSDDGQKIFRIERSFKKGNANWKVDSVMTAWITPAWAVRTENGLRIVKLVFPVAEGMRWNGYTLNNAGEKTFEIRDWQKSFTVKGKHYPDCLSVIQQDDSTLLRRGSILERYAKDEGLIYQEKKDLHYCYTSACEGKGIIDFGTIRIKELVSYEKH